MKIEVVSSLAEPVGKLWKELQGSATSSGKIFYVSSPLSSTPRPIYEWIIENSDTFENWNNVRFVLMDEQVEEKSHQFQYLDTSDPASYERFAKKYLLHPLEEKAGHPIPVVKPRLEDINSFNLERPIDLLILALGVNGNYANVMPNTDKSKSWHIAHLIQKFRTSHTQSGSNSYEGATFREYGMSLGPQEVIASRHVVVILSGEKKRALTAELFSHNEFDPKFPLSIIYDPEVRDRVIIFVSEELGDLCL